MPAVSNSLIAPGFHFSPDPVAFYRAYWASALLAGAYSCYNPWNMHMAGTLAGWYSQFTPVQSQN